MLVRAVREDEIPTMVRTDAAGFGEDGSRWLEENARWLRTDLERTSCAFEGDELVGTSRNYSMHVTVPGGAQVGAAGVSAVAVLPTHRRRGILRAMMTRMLDDAVERDEPVAMLTASEGGIYGRFGFGVTTRVASLSLDTRAIEFAGLGPEGRFRFLDPDEARKLEIELFERVRVAAPGAVSRPESWWTDVQWSKEMGNRFDVVYESPEGSLDGYVVYGVKDRWTPEPAHEIRIADFVAASPEATHALWRYLCEIDLVKKITDANHPLDSPLPWLLRSPRAAMASGVHDFVWHRILDVPAALAARTYPVAGRLTLEIGDGFRPGGAAQGTFHLEGGPDGSGCSPSEGAADLTCDVATLSAAWLGGVPWSELAGAGLVEERTAGSVATADAMFASSPLPFPYTWF